MKRNYYIQFYKIDIAKIKLNCDYFISFKNSYNLVLIYSLIFLRLYSNKFLYILYHLLSV